MLDRRQALATEYAAYRLANTGGNRAIAWDHLARAHILAQPHFIDHAFVHVRMIGFAIATSNWIEVRGQAMRLLLAPLGNLTGRLPLGNTGLSDVSAFRPMPIPDHLARFLMTPKADS